MDGLMAESFNILFTCAGRRVALLRGFRAAMQELGLTGKLIAADVTDTAPACHEADESVLVGAVRSKGYLDRLLKEVHQHKVNLVVPLTDLDLQLLADNQSLFADLGCHVMIASPEMVEICRDKFKTNELVSQAGLKPIRTYTVEQFLTHPFYPCFVKPVEGSAAFGASMIHDAHELRVHLATFGSAEMMVQEYIPGQEFTVDVYRSRAGETRCVVPRQRLEVRSGEVQKGVTVYDEEIIAAATRLADQLDGLWGVFCCQCRRLDTESPPRFFEINPRFGGGAPLSIAAGANLPRYLLEDVLDRPISAELGRFNDGLLMLRYDDAVFAQADDIAALNGYDTPEFR
jgi:carbamoyl-phosphate synthase large subunit